MERQRVILLAIDGLDWPTVRSMIEQHELPHIAAMLADGAWGDLDVESAVVGLDLLGAGGLLSPLLWTTAASGVYYFSHGIYDFRDYIENPAAPPLFSSTNVVCPRIWDMLTSFDRVSIVAGYMVTHPATPIEGVMVSDRFGEVAGGGVISPPEWADRLARQLGAADYAALVERDMAIGPMDEMEPWSAPPAMGGEQQERIAAILREFIAGHADEELDKYVRPPADDASVRHRALLYHRLLYPCLRDERFHRLFLYLLTQLADCAFAVCYYRMIDALSHGFWLDSPAAGPRFRERYRSALAQAYRRMDDYVGQVRSAAGGQDTLLLVSDHGFTGEPLPEGAAACEDLDYEPVGNHRGPGFFAAVGPGVRKGRISSISMLDLCPSILDLLGLPQADTFDGGVVPGLLHAGAPQKLDRIACFEKPALPPSGPALSAQDEKRILQHLQALGYVEGQP